MKYRHYILWLDIAIAVLLLLLSGCGVQPVTVSEPSVDTVKEVEKVVVVEEQPAASGEVNLITQADGLFEAQALTQAVNEFMLEHPSIKVNCTIVVPVGGWEEELAAWNPEAAHRCRLVVWQP